MADKFSEDSSISSPPGSYSTSGPKRETLTSRAKRIIGRHLELDDEPPPSKDQSTARGQNVKKSPTRRREQVLQAQRTHRQRTQGYIRELEKEVLRLRDSESALKAEVKALKAALEQNGLPLPEATPTWRHSMSPPIDSTYLFDVSSSELGDMGSITSVTIDLTELGRIEPEKWCSVSSALEETRPFELPTIVPADLMDFGANSATMTLREASVGNYGPIPVANPQAAIDFVLELERPCLGHIKHAHSQALQFPPLGGRAAPDFNHGPHHVFNTASTLLNSGATPDPMNERFQISTSNLEQLFQLSLSLNLGDDVTPVQIWANIRRISTRFNVDITILQMLRNEFTKYVRCNSFGTVIQRDIVSSVLSFFFPGELFVAVWE